MQMMAINVCIFSDNTAHHVINVQLLHQLFMQLTVFTIIYMMNGEEMACPPGVRNILFFK